VDRLTFKECDDDEESRHSRDIRSNRLPAHFQSKTKARKEEAYLSIRLNQVFSFTTPSLHLTQHLIGRSVIDCRVRTVGGGRVGSVALVHRWRAGSVRVEMDTLLRGHGGKLSPIICWADRTNAR